MVVVRVRDEDCVDAPKSRYVDRDRPLQMHDPVAQERVGDEPDLVQVDQDGGVPDVLDPSQRYTQSLSPWASGRDSSFFSVLFSIWRMRSRVTPNARPTSSRVHGWEPSRP